MADKDIGGILAHNGFTFSKKFGQNFITDTNLLKAIAADAGINKDDTVIEVGAGAGTLTRELSFAAKKVVSFEIDTRLQPVLASTLQDCQNVELIFKDILKTEVAALNTLAGGPYKVVANLPYYITTPIIFYFLQDFSNCKSLTVMVQKEVAQRLTAKAGTAEYGAITPQVSALGEAKYLRTVKRNMFNPEPNVDSAVVRIDIAPKENVSDFKLLQRVIASAFEMRRKTLANNLCKSFSLSKEDAASLIKSCGYSENARGETLDINGFIKLAEKIGKFKK